MGESKIIDRITFLAQKFDVFETTEEELAKKIEEIKDTGFSPRMIENGSEILGILSIKNGTEENIKPVMRVSVAMNIFTEMISSDPTPNKSCVQWMLNVFNRLIREGKNSMASAIRFVTEDLPQANTYIKLFEANKRKNKFKTLCSNSYILNGVSDPTDINQYKSLAQLFDAVDPFIPKNPTELERLLDKFVDSGQAIIPVKDRKFTIFIPKTRDASVIFGSFANWCTAQSGTGMFKSYTEDNRKPNGNKSDLYVIINNKFFLGESKEIYQIHFETSQIKDRYNNQDVSIFETVITESEGVSNFLYQELIEMAKACKTGIDNNLYLDMLINFGFCESLFELIDSRTPSIRVERRDVPRMPDLSRFKDLEQLTIVNAKLVELHESLGKLNKLEMLMLPDNKIKVLPSGIGNLKSLEFLNLSGNPIRVVPDEIKYLDKSNGGRLQHIVAREKDMGEESYKKLKELLPTITFL